VSRPPLGAASQERSTHTPEVPLPKITFVELLRPGKDDKRRVELAAVILSAAAASAVVEAGSGAELADAADSVAVGVEETWVTCVEPVPCRR
jgi:hypothetical protein